MNNEDFASKTERKFLKLIKERDDAEEWADKLAYAIGPIEQIGEHSNVNNPWQNALDVLEQKKPLEVTDHEQE